MPQKKNPKKPQLSRRRFLHRAGGSLAAVSLAAPEILLGGGSPNEKLNVAFIGCGGRGRAQVKGLGAGNNVAALADVDFRCAKDALESFPAARKYQDFRRMFDDMEKSIDVVAVSTPDHTHAVAAKAALIRGKHTYCEKPLAHSVYEVRELMKAARESNVTTQLGNQGHSANDIRRLVEWVRDGAIGRVHTVHAGCYEPIGPLNFATGKFEPELGFGSIYSRVSALSKRKEKHEVPKGLAWDLWLGPATAWDYHPMYLPFNWRGWRPFGCGRIGDWICHVVDPSFWALDLGAAKTVEVVKLLDFDPVKHADTFPRGAVFRFTFQSKHGPVTLYWYSGDEKIPRLDGADRDPPLIGAVLIGEKGMIQHGSHGAREPRLLPEAKMRDYTEPEQTIPRVPDHHQDFLLAVREGRKAGSDFATYGGPLTEIALLGTIALNFPHRKLTWDSESMRFTDCDEANRFIHPPYRKGWVL